MVFKGSRIFFKALLELVLPIIGILLISGIPTLFNHFRLNVKDYFQVLIHMMKVFASPMDIVYGEHRKIFPQIFTQYGESLLLCFFAFVIAFVLAFVVTYLTLLLFKHSSEKVKSTLMFIESLPDLFIIAVFQVLIIFIFNKTGLLLFQLASTGNERSLILPVLCLSIPITVQLSRFILQYYENEMKKPYVEFAHSKGLPPIMIYNRHIFRNVFVNLMNYSKPLVWFLLSNLIIIERLFNVPGITGFMINYPSPEVFAVGTTLLYFPIFILYKMSHMLIPAVNREGKVI
jgi:peptide/nickel transport system permease protein